MNIHIKSIRVFDESYQIYRVRNINYKMNFLPAPKFPRANDGPVPELTLEILHGPSL